MERYESRCVALRYGELVLVSGTNEIVPALDDAMDRIRTVASPLEDARVRRAANHDSGIGNVLVYGQELLADRTELVLSTDDFGF